MKNVLSGLIGLVVFYMVFPALAEDSGIIIKKDLPAGNCQIKSMTVRYHVGASVGEPVVKGAYKWEAGEDTGTDCLPENLVIWLKVKSKHGGHGYIKLDPSSPVKAGKGYGKPAADSPDWDSFICGFEGAKKIYCFTAVKAKAFYKDGMTVVDFRLSKE